MENNLATQQNLKDLGTDLRQEMATLGHELRHEMSAMRQELKDEISSVRQEFKEEISAFKQEMKEEFTSVKQNILLLDQKIIQSEQRMTIRLGAIVSVAMSILVAVMKLTN